MGENVKHTPGPWIAVEEEDRTIIGCGWDFLGRHIAYMSDGGVPRDEEWANTHLIAAAPELLKLAAQYRDDLHHPPSPDSKQRRLAAIEAVIAKAEGRP